MDQPLLALGGAGDAAPTGKKKLANRLPGQFVVLHLAEAVVEAQVGLSPMQLSTQLGQPVEKGQYHVHRQVSGPGRANVGRPFSSIPGHGKGRSQKPRIAEVGDAALPTHQPGLQKTGQQPRRPGNAAAGVVGGTEAEAVPLSAGHG